MEISPREYSCEPPELIARIIEEIKTIPTRMNVVQERSLDEYSLMLTIWFH